MSALSPGSTPDAPAQLAKRGSVGSTPDMNNRLAGRRSSGLYQQAPAKTAFVHNVRKIRVTLRTLKHLPNETSSADLAAEQDGRYGYGPAEPRDERLMGTPTLQQLVLADEGRAYDPDRISHEHVITALEVSSWHDVSHAARLEEERVALQEKAQRAEEARRRAHEEPSALSPQSSPSGTKSERLSGLRRSLQVGRQAPPVSLRASSTRMGGSMRLAKPDAPSLSGSARSPLSALSEHGSSEAGAPAAAAPPSPEQVASLLRAHTRQLPPRKRVPVPTTMHVSFSEHTSAVQGSALDEEYRYYAPSLRRRLVPAGVPPSAHVHTTEARDLLARAEQLARAGEHGTAGAAYLRGVRDGGQALREHCSRGLERELRALRLSYPRPLSDLQHEPMAASREPAALRPHETAPLSPPRPPPPAAAAARRAALSRLEAASLGTAHDDESGAPPRHGIKPTYADHASLDATFERAAELAQADLDDVLPENAAEREVERRAMTAQLRVYRRELLVLMRTYARLDARHDLGSGGADDDGRGGGGGGGSGTRAFTLAHNEWLALVRALGLSEHDVPESIVSFIYVRAGWTRQGEGVAAAALEGDGLLLPEMLCALVRLASYLYRKRSRMPLARKVRRLLRHHLGGALDESGEEALAETLREELDRGECADLFHAYRSELDRIYQFYACRGVANGQRRAKEHARRLSLMMAGAAQRLPPEVHAAPPAEEAAPAPAQDGEAAPADAPAAEDGAPAEAGGRRSRASSLRVPGRGGEDEGEHSRGGGSRRPSAADYEVAMPTPAGSLTLTPDDWISFWKDCGLVIDAQTKLLSTAAALNPRAWGSVRYAVHYLGSKMPIGLTLHEVHAIFIDSQFEQLEGVQTSAGLLLDVEMTYAEFWEGIARVASRLPDFAYGVLRDSSQAQQLGLAKLEEPLAQRLHLLCQYILRAWKEPEREAALRPGGRRSSLRETAVRMAASAARANELVCRYREHAAAADGEPSN